MTHFSTTIPYDHYQYVIVKEDKMWKQKGSRVKGHLNILNYNVTFPLSQLCVVLRKLRAKGKNSKVLYCFKRTNGICPKFALEKCVGVI